MRALVVSLCGALLLTGCVVIDDGRPGGPVIKRGGPPPWAPAHGHRAKQAYRFYPSLGVYVNVATGGYFYMSGGAWHATAVLPPSIVLGKQNFVVLELESDRPYVHYGEHKMKYKGNKRKKHWKSKGKGKGRRNKAGFSF